MGTDWKIDGTYFESCNCDMTCPCVFTSAPTTGECTAVVAWHVDKGSYGDVSLGGLNVALAVHSPGHMLETPWKVALYIDQEASEAQQAALTNIFGGQAGGHMAALGEHIGEVLGVKSVPIEYKAEGKRRSLRINGVSAMAIEGLEGQGGGDVTVNGQPVTNAPGYPTVVAKSEKLSYQDYGYNWELSGTNGFFSPFTYQGP
jgi:hypothetical protein